MYEQPHNVLLKQGLLVFQDNVQIQNNNSILLKLNEITEDFQTNLVLVNNHYKADSFSKIIIALKNKDQVRSIEVNSNQFKTLSNLRTDMTGEHVATLTTEFANLQKLYFISSALSLDAVQVLVSKCMQNQCKCSFLYFQESISSEQQLNVVSYCLYSQNPLFLSLIGCTFNSKLNHLINNLNSAVNLVQLDISHGIVQEEFFVKIFEQLKKIPTLKCLILKKLNFVMSESFYNSLSDFLYSSESIEYLDLKDNEISIKPFEILATSILLSNLKFCRLFGSQCNPLSQDFFNLLDRLIYNSNNLLYLDLSGMSLDQSLFPNGLKRKDRIGNRLYVNLLETDESFFNSIQNTGNNLFFIKKNQCEEIIAEVDPIKLQYEDSDHEYVADILQTNEHVDPIKCINLRFNHQKNHKPIVSYDEAIKNLRIMLNIEGNKNSSPVSNSQADSPAKKTSKATVSSLNGLKLKFKAENRNNNNIFADENKETEKVREREDSSDKNDDIYKNGNNIDQTNNDSIKSRQAKLLSETVKTKKSKFIKNGNESAINEENSINKLKNYKKFINKKTSSDDRKLSEEKEYSQSLKNKINESNKINGNQNNTPVKNDNVNNDISINPVSKPITDPVTANSPTSLIEPNKDPSSTLEPNLIKEESNDEEEYDEDELEEEEEVEEEDLDEYELVEEEEEGEEEEEDGDGEEEEGEEEGEGDGQEIVKGNESNGIKHENKQEKE